LLGDLFNVPTFDITATATAEAAPANAMTCVKPFTIPDKWIERQTPDWDADDTFQMWDHQQNPMDPADVYYDATDKARYTGYNAERDKGTEMMIRAGERSST